jgi:hypothetical protein
LPASHRLRFSHADRSRFHLLCIRVRRNRRRKAHERPGGRLGLVECATGITPSATRVRISDCMVSSLRSVDGCCKGEIAQDDCHSRLRGKSYFREDRASKERLPLGSRRLLIASGLDRMRDDQTRLAGVRILSWRQMTRLRARSTRCIRKSLRNSVDLRLSKGGSAQSLVLVVGQVPQQTGLLHDASWTTGSGISHLFCTCL